MPNSYTLYNGNGAITDFTVVKPYLLQSHVTVEVSGVSVPFTWLSTTSVRCTTAPVTGTANVKIKRYTPRAALVTFADSAGLVMDDLNTQGLQARYIAEEQEDAYLDNVLTDLSVATSNLQDAAVTPVKLALQAVRTVLANDTAGSASPTARSIDDLTVASDFGASRRDLSARFGDAINAKDYGAVGDGATDDTVAIQNAATAAGVNGKVLYISGTSSYYRLTGTISVPAGVTVRGDGLKSRIKQTAREQNVFDLSNDCVLDALNIEGDGLSSGGVSFAKNNGVFILSVRNCAVRNCFISGFEFNGIQLQNAVNYEIAGNILWDNKYGNDTAADIIAYSGSDGGRGIITNNRSFSNNSQGIYVDALGFDHDITVSDNICVTLNASTWAEVASGSLQRRHGIVVGYNGGVGRYIVSGNICRNTRQSGIYYQSATAPTGTVLITNNQCSLNGVNPIEPTFCAGIYIASQGKGDLVANNTVDDFTYDTEFANAGIRVSPATAGQVAVRGNTLVTGNVIRRSGCHGIVLGGYAQNVTLDNNVITDSVRSDIGWYPVAGEVAVGNHIIKNNRCIRLNTTSPAIDMNYQSSTQPTFVIGNHLTGSNAATNAATNCGIKWTHNPRIIVTDNHVVSFYHGVYQSNYLAGRTFLVQVIDRNHFNLCTNGIMVAGTTTAPVLPVQDNVFVGHTTKASGAALGSDVVVIGQRYGDKIYFQSAAAPTLGTWVIGDRSQQLTPVVGNPKGWVCTVAGNPGTWVSEGNL